MVKQIVKKLSTMRVDIKNAGSTHNSVTIKSKNAKISKPSWFTNTQGVGQIVESYEPKQEIKIKAIKSGKLILNFRGPWLRHKDKRIPLWIDYKSINIDGKEILAKPVAAWHDAPFHHEMAVKDGQIVHIKIKQAYHPYSRTELKNIILKLNLGTKYEQPHVINKVYREISRKGIGHFLFHKTENDRCKKYYICGVRIWKKNVSIYKYLNAHVSMLVQAQAKKSEDLYASMLNHINAQFSQIERAINIQKTELSNQLNVQSAQLIDLKTEQMNQVSSEIQNHANNIANLINYQINTFRSAEDKAHHATHKMLNDDIKEVTNLLKAQEQLLNIQNQILSVQESASTKLDMLKEEQSKPAIKTYDHIISLGLNCEISYQIKMKFGTVESHLLSWAAVRSKKLVDIINNPHIIYSDEIEEMTHVNMWKCLTTNVAFHGRRLASQLKNADGSRNMEEVAREKEEVISRVKHLCDKFESIGQSFNTKLYCLGLHPSFLDCTNDELADFCMEVYYALVKKYNNVSLLIIAESSTRYLSALDNGINLYVRFISKFAPYNRATYPEFVDLNKGGEIFEEFRTRYISTRSKVYKFES